VAAAGQVDDDVGAGGLAAGAVFVDRGAEAFLEAVLLALAQAGFFEQVAQDEFAPVALRFGRAAQGGGEVVGFGAELLIELFQRFELAAQFDAPGQRIFLRLFDLAAKIVICTRSGFSS
jgi:hypothetical protein